MRTMLIMLTSKIETPRNLSFINTVFSPNINTNFMLIIMILKLTTEQVLLVNSFSKYKNVFLFNMHSNCMLLNWIIKLTNETRIFHY